LDQDPAGITPAQRQIVALHDVFNRIAQGGNTLYLDGFAPDNAHFKITPANRSTAANTKDGSPLAWVQMT
jgi:hypothetical protein